MSPSQIQDAWPFLKGANFKPCGGETTANVVAYVKKQGRWEEYGRNPMSHAEPVDREKKPTAKQNITAAIKDLASNKATIAEVMS